MLFETAIPLGHRGFLDAYMWPVGDFGHRPYAETQLIELLPETARSSVGMSEVRDFWGDGSNEGRCPVIRFTVELELRQLDYRRLFRLIANDDLGLEPSAGARVYLVDETDPLVFLMYDDRGAILHAAAVDRLRSLRTSAGRWLVERDPFSDSRFAGEG